MIRARAGERHGAYSGLAPVLTPRDGSPSVGPWPYTHPIAPPRPRPRSTMPLTPADIHNMDFGKASLGRRGYHEDEVDALLDEVTQEMIRLLEENDALHHMLDAGAGTPLDEPNM